MKTGSKREEMNEIIYGFCISQCVYVASELGIPDILAEGPKTIRQLAEMTGSDPGAMERIMRTLEDKGIFMIVNNDIYTNTPLAEMLRSGTPDSLNPEVKHMLHPSSWQAWGDLLYSVKTGKASFPRVFGEDAWTYRSRNPELSRVFNSMAAEMSRREADSILEHLDLSDVKIIIDVGGGQGELITRLLSRSPDLEGVLFDQPHVISGAEINLEKSGLSSRCRMESGNFFNNVPKGGDLYLLKAIIHNWSDEKAITILDSCREAMASRARIVLIESIMDPTVSLDRKIKDLHMMVIHGGKERTSAEYGRLLEAAGFQFEKTVDTGSGMSLIEASPAG